MGDPLFLSLWLKNFSALALPVYLKKAMQTFPHSKLDPRSVLRVYALSFHEAPQLEEFYDQAVDPQQVIDQAQEFLHTDCAFQFETRWDLYQWDDDWNLKPARVRIEIFGPEFDSPRGEQVRIDFDSEHYFLLNEHSDQLRPVQANIRSLLHLSQDMEEELGGEKRILWSEDEEDFVERLKTMLD